MIHEIGEILKGKLSGQSYVERIAGIVDVANDVKQTGKGSIIKRFPIACNVEGIDCNETGFLNDLVPNSSKKSVIFFEDITGVAKIGQRGVYYNFEARPRLVAWINKKKLGKTDCSISTIIIANIIKLLETIKHENVGYFQNINVEVVSEVPRSPAIFNRYTFDNMSQYLMHPYEYFALNLKVNFWMSPDCLDEFIVEPEINC